MLTINTARHARENLVLQENDFDMARLKSACDFGNIVIALGTHMKPLVVAAWLQNDDLCALWDGTVESIQHPGRSVSADARVDYFDITSLCSQQRFKLRRIGFGTRHPHAIGLACPQSDNNGLRSVCSSQCCKSQKGTYKHDHEAGH